MVGVIPGGDIFADEVMNAIGSNFNDTAQMIFNADYIGFDSRLTNSTTPNLKNVKYSTFTTDDADVNFGFFYEAASDLYATPDLSGVTEYVIIEATSLSSPINTNDCKSIELSAGKWLIYCTTGTDAVHRAQIIKTLFNGASGKINSFTSVTSVKTSHANDVGKQAHNGYAHTSTNTNGTYTGTFVNTATNTNCSSWSNCTVGPYGDFATWEIPSGTVRNGGNTDELGIDTTGDELDNPATCQCEEDGNVSGDNNSSTFAIILCVGDITWVNAGTLSSYSNIDFYTDYSIPIMTAADTLTNEGAYTSTLIFKDTIVSTDNAIPVINSTIDATSSQVISVSADGGSNYTDVNNAEIARPTAGTALWRKIVITRTDLSKEDIVTEQAVKYEFY